MGSVRPRPSGKWEARWYGHDGLQQSRNFTTKTEAKRWVKEEEGRVAAGHGTDHRLGKTSFRVVAEEWFKTNPGGKERTRIGYRSLLDNHVLPYFGDMPVNRIAKTTVQQFLAHMANEGKKPGTIRNAFRNVVKPVLDTAVDKGYLAANPAIRVRAPRSDHDEMLFLTAEQVVQLADEIAEPHDILVMFAAYSGLRAGEIGALRVKNLDLMRLRVTVEESVSEVPRRGLVYGPTKTYAKRTLTLPTFLREPLTEYVGPRAGDSNAFVFVGAQGGAVRHSDFYARYFRPAVIRLVDRGHWTERLRGLRFHDLRHTAASLLINPPIGAHPKVIQQRLGHSSINTTFDRYGHLFPGLDEELGEKLDALHVSSIQEPDGEVVTLG